MANGDELLRRGVKVHPVFLIGVGVGLIALGSILGVTLFASFASLVGVSVLVLSLEWIVVAFITIIIGLWRSFDELG